MKRPLLQEYFCKSNNPPSLPLPLMVAFFCLPAFFYFLPFLFCVVVAFGENLPRIRWTVSEGFPSKEVISAYKTPQVNPGKSRGAVLRKYRGKVKRRQTKNGKTKACESGMLFVLCGWLDILGGCHY